MVDIPGALKMARPSIESMYTGSAIITERQEVTRANGSTGFQEVVTLTDQPCRLSFSRFPAAAESSTATGITQEIKLFIAPEIVIKPGAKLTVTQNEVTTDYACSGVPAMYTNHQEITLHLFDRWS